MTTYNDRVAALVSSCSSLVMAACLLALALAGATCELPIATMRVTCGLLLEAAVVALAGYYE